MTPSQAAAIVYVTPYFPPYGAGGAERTCALHAGLLARAGLRVIVISPDYGPEAHVPPGVDFRRFALTKLATAGQQVDEKLLFTSSFARQLSDQIVHLLRGERIDCLHAQNTHVLAGTSLAAKRLNRPLVSHIRDTGGLCLHGASCLISEGRDLPPINCSWFQNYTCERTIIGKRPMPTLARPLTLVKEAFAAGSIGRQVVALRRRQHCYQISHRIAFASNGLLDLYRQTVSYVGDRGRVVFAPVLESDDINPRGDLIPANIREILSNGHKYILYAGKLSKGKGADVLSAAQRIWRNTVPDLRLVIAGNVHGDWGFDTERTVFTGFLKRPELGILYRHSLAAVAPASWPEPLGWSSLDAGRFGKPIVATRVGGVPEAVIDGHTGILVEKGDSKALATAIEAVVQDSELASRLGRAAFRFVQSKFGANAVTRQLSELYDFL